jgi:ATP-binding cassette subfamily B protein
MSESSKNKTIKTLSLLTVFIKLWPYIKMHKTWFLFCILLAAIYSVAGRALPMLFGYAVDEGIKKQNLNLIYQISIIYLLIELIHLSVSYFKTYTMTKLGNKLMYDIRQRVIEHVQSFPQKYFDKNPIGKTVTRVTNDVMSLGQLFNEGFASIFVNILEVLSIIGALALISPRLTFYVLIPLPILVLVAQLISNKLRGNFKESKRVLATINAFNSESLNGMKTIQLFNRSKEKRKMFAQFSNELLHFNSKTVKNYAMLWPLIGFFRIASLCTAILVGGLNLQKWNLTIGQLSAFLLLVREFFPPFRTILERYNQFQDSLASCDRIFDLFEVHKEVSGLNKFSQETINGSIKFKNLSFRYEPNKPLVLDDINLQIKPGESVALVGRTGSGKTTIISLMQKLYPYSDG